MNKFRLNRKIKFADLFLIPFRISKVLVLLKFVDVIIYALLPAIQAIVTANIVDLSVVYLVDNSVLKEIILNFVGLNMCIAMGYLNDLIMTYVNTRIEMDILSQYQKITIEKRSNLKYLYIENETTKNLISRVCVPIEENQFIKGYNNLFRIISMGITIISLLILVSKNIWWLGIVIFFIATPLFKISLSVGKNTYEAQKESDKYGREAEYLQSVLRDKACVEERSLFSFSEFVNKMWFEKYEMARKISLKAEFKYWVRIKGAGMVVALLSLIILLVLLYPLYIGEITIGLFMSLTVAYMELINNISWNLVDIMKELASSSSFIVDLNQFLDLEEIGHKQERVETFESIIFDNVSFKYPFEQKYVLRNFSMSIEKGIHYAFVGKNGAGKTTIIKLLLGLYDNYEGSIWVNGIELRKIDTSSLHDIFGVVFQDFIRYEISFKDNITIAREGAYDKYLFKCIVDDLGIKQVIDRLPQKERTHLGKTHKLSVELSGGEWQKVAIARAMYSSAPICILDEPTAALDPITESNIYKLFQKASIGRTMIMITHRLSSTKIADCIVVVDDGHVKEYGSHEELMKKNGLYAEMYNTQKGWYEDV